MAEYVEHISKLRNIGLKVSYTTDQRAALEGADFVVVAISTGGFDSMRHDVEIPARHGIKLSVGDAGPAGVSRTLRNVPVMVGIARDMEEICPDAWLLNLTNPMTQLVRAITRETSVKTVGLCHEVTICRFYLSMWLGESFLDLEPTVVGVNHLPFMTKLMVGDADDGLDRLARAARRPAVGARRALPFAIPEGIGHGPEAERRRRVDEGRSARRQPGEDRAVPTVRCAARFERPAPVRVLRRPAHRGVGLGRALARAPHDDRRARGARGAVQGRPRGAPRVRRSVDDAFGRDGRAAHRLDHPRQAAHVPAQPARTPARRSASRTTSWSRRCASPTASGVRGGEPAEAPGVLGEYVRRMTAVHELTVEAAISGKRDDVIAAMLADPVASKIDYDEMVRMTDELLAATKPWLPQFA